MVTPSPSEVPTRERTLVPSRRGRGRSESLRTFVGEGWGGRRDGYRENKPPTVCLVRILDSDDHHRSPTLLHLLCVRGKRPSSSRIPGVSHQPQTLVRSIGRSDTPIGPFVFSYRVRPFVVLSPTRRSRPSPALLSSLCLPFCLLSCGSSDVGRPPPPHVATGGVGVRCPDDGLGRGKKSKPPSPPTRDSQILPPIPRPPVLSPSFFPSGNPLERMEAWTPSPSLFFLRRNQ